MNVLAGPQQAVNAWTEADAMSVMFLTFDSLRLAKVNCYAHHSKIL